MVTAPIRSLAWEPTYAVGAALEKTKKKSPEFESAISELCGFGQVAQCL